MKVLLGLVAVSAMCHLSLAHTPYGLDCAPGECGEERLLYCRLTYSSCLTGTCQCYQGYVHSPEARKCVLIKKVGASCRVQEECPTGSKCTDKYICECDPAFTSGGAMDDNLACRDAAVIALLGEACTSTTTCYGYSAGVFPSLGSAACVSDVCACPSATHTGSGNDCVLTPPPPYLIGSSCSSASDCPAASTCTDTTNVCTCNTGLFAAKGNTECLANVLAVNMDCSNLNATTDCANTLTCHRCTGADFRVCTESVVLATMPVAIVTTTESFGLQAGASRSVVGVATAILAVLALLM